MNEKSALFHSIAPPPPPPPPREFVGVIFSSAEQCFSEREMYQLCLAFQVSNTHGNNKLSE